MPPLTGTYSLQDLTNITNQSVIEFGLDNALPAIQSYLNVRNEITNRQLQELTTPVTDAERAWGGAGAGRFQRVDDFGRGATQKTGEPGRVAFPLEKFVFPVGFTRDFLYQATPAKLAEITTNVEAQYRTLLQNLIAYAVFYPTNTTFKDQFDTQMSLGVKAFLNADGASIPPGQSGQSFTGASHTHYTAVATLSDAAARALIANVIEHGHSAGIRVYINATDYATWAALDGFVPMMPGNVIVASTTERLMGALDLTNTENRQVGAYDGYPVHTRSWVPAGYAFAFAADDARKPLARRQKKQAMLRGLRLESSEKAHPLYVDSYECYEGFAPFERTNGAVLQWGDDTTYDTPSFTY
jgi:hypothetical protein